MQADHSSILIHSTSQLITLTPEAQRGEQLGNLGIIPDGALLIEDESITAVGKTVDLIRRFPRAERFDAGGKVVMPGFVDAHTHLVWAGDRAAEFEMRLEGKSYMEIMSAGGGIQASVNATRNARKSELYEQSHERAQEMLRYGTTSCEAKSGYGLNWDSEIKQLEVLLELNRACELEIHPTFLAAHAVPKEYTGRADEYVTLICNSMLPELKSWWERETSERELPFVDVFCEKGAFNLEQTERIFKAAKSLGFRLKIHADEFENLGGTRLAVNMKAISADHLVKTSAQEIRLLAESDTVAVALPCTPFGLNEAAYTPAREIIRQGGVLALASDLNPGTAWCGNMQFVIALACRAMQLTPAQAIAAATINAAAALGIQENAGSLQAGKQADLLVLQVEDYRHLAYRFGGNLVKDIFKKGKRVHFSE